MGGPWVRAARLLATVANALGLHTTAEGAMVAAWVAKDAEMVRQERVQAKREAIASELRHEAEAASSLVSELTAQVEAARRAQEVVEGGMDVLETETHNMHLKAIEYEQRIASTEERLKSLGYRPELGHLALEAMAEQVDSLERSLAETEEALKRYDSIPPSAAGLAAMLEHSQKELAEVHAAMGSAFVHGGPGLAAAARGGSGGGLGGRGGGGGVGPGAFGFGGGGA
ncbi:hypothetical protein PLESTF_001148100 [Pleodorina starrii]|nr:hypothetical protein PLESTF_001148100 [Pleodorina starrii]